MATSDSPVADEDVASRIQNSEAVQAPNNDVEMAQLPAQNAISPSTAASPDAVATLHDQGEVVDPPASLDPPQDTESPRPTPLVRSETAEFALGPDGAALPPQLADSPEPVLRITLMLTTGARHPYSISKKYLAARKVQATDAEGNFDPREMSAYKLKELIWTDWRPEWEPRPRDPAAIRLIILGRMLEDKSQLKESPFSLAQSNVVHMTVKPADLLDDDAEGAAKTIAKSLRGRSAGDGQSAGCCRCTIQ